MKSIPVLTCLCFIGVTSIYGASKRVLDYVTFISGNFDNKAQTYQVGDNHDFMQARFIPVDIKCFQPCGYQELVGITIYEYILKSLVYFAEVGSNNVIHFFAVGEVTDGIEDTVSVYWYNFTTDYTKYKPREFNVDNLSKLSCQDFQGDPDCIASFKVTNGFVYGNVPHCVKTVNRKHPRYTALFNCDSSTLTVPMYSQQTSTMEPYELLRSGKKYPLINPPNDYVSPCGN